MKLRAIFAGLALAAATLAFASNLPTTYGAGGPPTPLCGPDDTTCTLDH